MKLKTNIQWIISFKKSLIIFICYWISFMYYFWKSNKILEGAINIYETVVIYLQPSFVQVLEHILLKLYFNLNNWMRKKIVVRFPWCWNIFRFNVIVDLSNFQWRLYFYWVRFKFSSSMKIKFAVSHLLICCFFFQQHSWQYV